MSYNFENLSPLDFEKLSIDLLQERFGSSIEPFTPGKDWCIDGRFIDDTGTMNIIQCKHIKKFSDLKSNLTKEFKKIQNQNKIKKPFNYILAVSTGLTPQNKEEIKQLCPLINREENIFGRDDLNSLLRKYPEVEKAHFKLWLNSSAVLEKIFNNDIFTRSKFEEKSIKRKIKLYVKTESFKSVYDKLKENNFCIISGAPGVGKTTLTEMLICYYLSKKYELVEISRDIKEAFKTYSPNKRIVFYYDDFLGTTFLKDTLPKNEDSDLVKFINNIKEDENKKFILTTREYILKQAIQTYEKIKNSDILSGKFIIELKEYTPRHRAKILFNHLYFSEIDKEYLENLKETKKYRDIVRHKNFNPRLIEFMCAKNHLANISHNKYSDWCIKNLDNPKKIWEYAFKNISIHSRVLCYFISISKSSLRYPDIEQDFNLFYKKYCNKYNLPFTSNPFQESIKEIEDSFISLKKENSFIKIEFINPSVIDFLESLIRKDTDLLKNLIKISLNISQIQCIFSIIKSKNEDKLFDFLEDTEVQEVILNLIKKQNSRGNQEEKRSIFSFLFKMVSDDFLKSNESFLKNLVTHFINRLNPQMYNEGMSLSECLTCLNIFKKKKGLYFGKRKDIIEKAKHAFCHNIKERHITDELDIINVKEFMNNFPSVMDEQTENQVIDKALQIIDEWYDATPSSDSEIIRSFADSIHEIESAFGFDNEKSKELYAQAEEAEELEMEKSDYEFESAREEGFLNHQNMKQSPDISNNLDDISNDKLDEMFKKL